MKYWRFSGIGCDLNRSGISCALIRNKKRGPYTPHTSYSVLIPQRQPGDILYQYVTAHISSSLASALSATKKLSSFSSGGWAVRDCKKVGHQSRARSLRGRPIRAPRCVTKQAPPSGTCSSFSKCFYLLHLYPPSVLVAFEPFPYFLRPRRVYGGARCAFCPARNRQTNNRNPHYYDIISPTVCFAR